jgi:glycosyltransferase involved in cell wall biosynthesis
MTDHSKPSRALRIAFMHPAFWPEVRRGGERFVAELARGLMARGHRPRLITSHAGRPSRSVEDGLPIRRHWRPPEGRLRRLGFDDYLTHVPFSYLSLRLGDDDVAHPVYPTDALAAARWSRRTGRPSVLSYMGVPVSGRRIRGDAMPRAARGCTVVTALSRAVADGLWRELRVEARVIYPGVDLDAFRPAARRAERPTIFCPAPIEQRRKRIPLLVSAFRLLRRERPDARLLLLRPADPEVAAQIVREEDGVELVDAVEEPRELAPRYAEAWVCALPSYEEAFGIALIEALAAGTPVVGSNREAFPEIVDRPEIGRLFDGDDEQALASALLEALELAEDPAAGRACRERAADFSIDSCVDAYEELYRELLDGGVT